MASGKDSITQWLDNASRYPVLPPEEVIRLGHIIQNPETSTAKRQKAVAKMVRHNLLLIPIIVKRVLANKRSYNYMDDRTEDLFQSATIGLTRAAQLYDPTKGYRFSTYASAWIFQAVQRDIYNNMSSIRVPENTLRALYKCYEEGDNAFIDQTPKNRIRFMSACAALNCGSLDVALPSDNTSLLSLIADKSESEQVDSLEMLMGQAKLTSRQKDIAVLHYENDMTLVQIATKLNTTRSVVQRELKNVRKRVKALVA